MTDAVTAAIKQWGGWVVGAAFAIWTLQVKMDGMLEYKSRADRAEATVDEKNDQRDRADKKERDRQ